MSDWHETTFGEIVELKRGYDLPNSQRREGRVQIISSSGPSGFHDEAKVAGPGVVTGRYGTVGQLFYVENDFWPLNTALYVRDFKGNRPRFVYYFLKTIDWISFNDKSGVPGINRNDVHRAPVSFPAVGIQHAIEELLGALDDKIELNRRTNETLEAMARTLFKDWFVDFGPTRAKAEGRAPYLAPDLWSLFPDRLNEETGLPEGWEEKPLDQVADFLNGLALQKFPAIDGADSLPVIKIAELRGGISPKTDRASRELPEKYIVRDGDFLFSWSGSLLAKFWTEGEGALNQHLFKVTSDNYPAWFFSQWVHHHLEEFQAIAASKATTMGHIQRGHLSAAMTCCPPPDVLAKLGQTLGPLVQRTITNALEDRTLAQTRDLLLPKLMSGEIRLREAEQIAEAAL